MSYYLIPYLHVLSFMILFAALVTEHLIFRPAMTARQAKTLVRVDVVYGIAALFVVATGILRVLYFGKGQDYYLASTLFLVKTGIFLAVALLSVGPTMLFVSWRKDVRAGIRPHIEEGRWRLVTIILRLELLGLLAIPLLAAMLARGAG